VKRYDIDPNRVPLAIEGPPGEWVRFDDAESELAKLRVVVDSLPRCDHSACRKPATVRGVTTGGEYEYNVSVCDEHAEHLVEQRQLPYANALRELEKP
jgi:hypothetical protein